MNALSAPWGADRVVVGLGSPFLGDDGVGPQLVRLLAQHHRLGVRLVEAHAGGLLLLDELAGARQAIIVDALLDGRRTPGEVLVAGMEGDSCHATCSHDCSLPQALAIGRAMGMSLPDDQHIHLVAIVAAEVSLFTEVLSPQVAASLPQACQTVLQLIDGNVHFDDGRSA